ncbi:MAG: CxxxxCH/CxxCH domain-containing protein [Anaeromyxobacter sp.]
MTASFSRHTVRTALAVLALASGPLACGSHAPEKAAAATTRTQASAAVVTACGGAQTCTPTDAHARHQANGLDCVSCHPCGGQFGFKVGYTFPGGTTILPTDHYTPASGSTPASCTVACHAPMGSPSAPVTWNAASPLACVGCHDVAALLTRFPTHPAVSPTASRADCEACHSMDLHTTGTVKLQGHPAAWMDRASAGFHAPAANRGLATCKACHRADLSGGLTNVACTSCHRASGTANDFAKCTACHGGTENATGAPPAAIWGFAGDPNRGGGTADPVRVGAHTAHVSAGQFGPAFGCETCHVTPPSIVAPGHIDDTAGTPVASLTFGGLAVNGGPTPGWTRGSATCSNTYCHGASLPGGALTNPVWTAGAGQVYCGSCHAVPPPPPHVAVDTTGGFGVCSPCHTDTVDAAGHIIAAAAGGKHLNGFIEASGHDANWMDRTSPGFHAFAANRGLDNCKPCHGAQLEGGSVRTACTQCHKAGGPGNDFATCTACHGGNLDATGAPPAAIWGYAGDPLRGGGTADALRVGAHRKHVAQATGKSIDCAACHVKPAVWTAPGHVDDATPVATVTFAGAPGAVPAGAPATWSRATGSCAATYCHGNYQGEFHYTTWDWALDAPIDNVFTYVGKKATPGWLDTGLTCASCHGNPPSGGVWHSPYHGNNVAYTKCQVCHPDASTSTTGANVITNAAMHVDGKVDVAPTWVNRCFGCH